MTKLHFHRYRYFAYERDLALREVRKIASVAENVQDSGSIDVHASLELKCFRKLTYFSRLEAATETLTTIQHDLEQAHRVAAGSGNRQITRYSAHGLHEYKGRFNPQLARFLIHYLGASQDASILDPFCGSGTTLVESSLAGMKAFGVDMNPLAVFMSNAKLAALSLPASEIERALQRTLKRFASAKKIEPTGDLERIAYLENWFPAENLACIEKLRHSIGLEANRAEAILFSLASDLLRQYSLQEPGDMRIRRRISEFPKRPFIDAFTERASVFIRNLKAAQNVTGLTETNASAVTGDSRQLKRVQKQVGVTSLHDLVITSPPYATALPYIDTQRLSLVWLSLCPVSDIRILEGCAVGSREKRSDSVDWEMRLNENADHLPSNLHAFCTRLKNSISTSDGFRRKAVPKMLYRYFADMRDVFIELPRVLKRSARMAFVVGANRTTLGGELFQIDTPRFLADIAEDVGFRVTETIPLQTYQRYGMHQKNATDVESATILERN